MMDERNLKLHGEEVDKNNSIKDRGVTLTRVINPVLLRRTAAGTKTSERRDQNLPTHYFRVDPSPQGAAYTTY
jgi:hypothetical protein